MWPPSRTPTPFDQLTKLQVLKEEPGPSHSALDCPRGNVNSGVINPRLLNWGGKYVSSHFLLFGGTTPINQLGFLIRGWLNEGVWPESGFCGKMMIQSRDLEVLLFISRQTHMFSIEIRGTPDDCGFSRKDGGLPLPGMAVKVWKIDVCRFARGMASLLIESHFFHLDLPNFHLLCGWNELSFNIPSGNQTWLAGKWIICSWWA